MWILVIAHPAELERPEGACAVLRDLGRRVQCASIDSPWQPAFREVPPAVVLIEASHDLAAARGALARLRGLPELADVPILEAIPMASLQRLECADGFDDFVLVPYIPAELYTRIRRVEARRAELVSLVAPLTPARIEIGPVGIDLAAHEVVLEGRPVEMTRREFELLRFLCQNRGRVVTREELLRSVWGVQIATSRTVDMHMRRLRMKLGGRLPIETRRGVGYMLRAA